MRLDCNRAAPKAHIKRKNRTQMRTHRETACRHEGRDVADAHVSQVLLKLKLAINHQEPEGRRATCPRPPPSELTSISDFEPPDGETTDFCLNHSSVGLETLGAVAWAGEAAVGSWTPELKMIKESG